MNEFIKVNRIKFETEFLSNNLNIWSIKTDLNILINL